MAYEHIAKRSYPRQVCWACVYPKRRVEVFAVKVHRGRCRLCHKCTWVCSPSYYGWPEFEGFRKCKVQLAQATADGRRAAGITDQQR